MQAMIETIGIGITEVPREVADVWPFVCALDSLPPLPSHVEAFVDKFMSTVFHPQSPLKQELESCLSKAFECFPTRYRTNIKSLTRGLLTVIFEVRRHLPQGSMLDAIEAYSGGAAITRAATRKHLRCSGNQTLTPIAVVHMDDST
jgi:hypothetical protein